MILSGPFEESEESFSESESLDIGPIAFALQHDGQGGQYKVSILISESCGRMQRWLVNIGSCA